MAKRKTKKISLIIGIMLAILLLALLVSVLVNFDSLFGGEAPSGGDIQDGVSDGVDDTISMVLRVYCNGAELTAGEPIQAIQSDVTFTIESNKAYSANFVKYPGYREWDYEVDDGIAKFIPNVNVLEQKNENNTYTIYMPYDVMDWVLRQHEGATEDSVVLPTDINHNVVYIALKVDVEGNSYYYPIQFDLNGVWTKVYLDKNEIVFCD